MLKKNLNHRWFRSCWFTIGIFSLASRKFDVTSIDIDKKKNRKNN